MTYSARILADSIASGVRLTTFEITFPRFILAEFNTHRMLSRNSASSRAIPVEKRIAQVRQNPFVPEAFSKNKAGMQAETILENHHAELARDVWIHAAHRAANYAEDLAALKVHKQHANRILEPYVWHTAVVTATDWDNFFALRTHQDAQPEMQKIAQMMYNAYAQVRPKELVPYEWHLPYVTLDEKMNHAPHALIMLSVVKCSAVSYERQETERTFEQVVERYEKMVTSAHWSPFEHQAKVASYADLALLELGNSPEYVGNFRWPWLQYRKIYHRGHERIWQGHKPEVRDV